MATVATVSRGGTSVDIQLFQEGGNLSVARDVGKPNLSTQAIGREDPNHQDLFNALDVFTVAGFLDGSNAYADAKTLAEDLIKARATTGTPLQLDLSDLPSRSTYDIAPNGEEALSLTYIPGEKDLVTVQLSAVVVDETVGGSQTSDSNLSADAGSGIKIKRGGDTVTLDGQGEEMTRTVGRPGIQLSKLAKDDPLLIDQNKPATDVFEISGDILSSAGSESNTLEETIIKPRLVNDTPDNLELHFQGNLFNLDAYRVIPSGSQALRTVFRGGEGAEVVGVPSINLQVVANV